MTAQPLLAVDAPSLYFRAFHGIPEKAAQTSAGEPVNAIRGFMDMLAQLIRTRHPDRMVCALDNSWRPAWRVELVPSYKKHRVAHGDVEVVPPSLEKQIPVLLEVLKAVGIPAFGVDGYEADDVLGTLAAGQPAPVEVVSGDRDLFQLVDDERKTRLLYVGRGVAKLEDADNALVETKYGVPAKWYADFAAMRGDASDGLPGVAGVGEKTAARLVMRYGGVEQILAALDDPDAGFAPGLRTKLDAARDYLAKALPVCKVALDVKLPDFDAALPRSPKDADALLALADRWNLASPAKRLVDALAG
ncbi:5'-3' exonuclease [Actinoplanes sp. TRM 88003]|uniref:5'-3' exonuclease n=1 Tax=Paractinoplanes aksuensis TaxID=2939490 RepID=A0ABT1DFV3_9ACTN|nr:5'-3' exonuclease [Actinoplanes aksuensis]MCO8269716.1 5'-3' exonuclease [Actinoplanes aksuensis]